MGITRGSTPIGTFAKNVVAVAADAATVTFDLLNGNRQLVTLGGNRTLAVVNDALVPSFTLVIDTGVGGFAPVWWAGLRWSTADGSAPTVTTAAKRRDVFSFIRFSATDYLGFVVAQNQAGVPFLPDAPTSPVATRGNTQVSVAFVAPAVTGNTPITSYTATSSPGGLTATGSASPLVVTGLTNGTAYTFSVRATNIVGSGAESVASNSITPQVPTVPSAPTIGTATPADTTVALTWTAPADNGDAAVTGYVITPYIGASAQATTTVGNVLAATVTGLTNGTAYTFKVAAINSVGTGAQSAASASATPFLFDPLVDVAGCITYIKPSASIWQTSARATLATADGDPVGAWDDSSTGVRHLLQATAGLRPTLRTNALNGLRGVRFSRAVAGQLRATFTLPQPYTVFAVAAQTGGGLGYFYDGVTLNSGALVALSLGVRQYAGVALDIASITESNFNIFCNKFNGTSSLSTVNGSPTASGNAGVGPPGGVTMGNAGTPQTGFDGDFVYLIIYNTALSSSDCNKVGNFLASKTGIAWTNLP